MSRILAFILHLPLASTLCSLLGVRVVMPAWLASQTVLQGAIFRHAMSTPVTVLSGCIETSLRTENRNTLVLKQAQIACQSIERLLLSLTESKHEQQVIAVVAESTEVVRACQMLYPSAQLSSHIDCSHNCIISGNSVQWQEALNCLITNAIEAYDTNEMFKSVVISLHQSTSKLTIEIIDYARGMSGFTQFLLLLPGTTAKATGTGLGLAFVRHFVEDQLGGKLEIDSRVGRGTRVRWIIPIAAQKSDTQSRALS